MQEVGCCRMIVTRKTTRTYHITGTSWPNEFGVYGDMEDRANELHKPLEKRGLSKCFVCNQEFDRSDKVYLTMVKGHKNVFLCGNCAARV